MSGGSSASSRSIASKPGPEFAGGRGGRPLQPCPRTPPPTKQLHLCIDDADRGEEVLLWQPSRTRRRRYQPADVLGDGYRAGIIMNACDVVDDRLMVWPREKADLRGLGFDVVELDLREHFSDRDGLNQRLETFDLLWVAGGKTFALARAMDACGFAELARERIESGLLTYAGYSAGVCVLAPGFEGIELMDDADTIPAGYPPECQPRTLGWIPWRVVPHWNSPHPESPLVDRAVAYRGSGALRD